MEKGKRNLLLGAGIVVAVLVLLVATCPGRDKHHDAIAAAFNEYVSEKVDDNTESDNIFSDLVGMGAKWAASTGADAFLTSNLMVKDYGLCSVGRIKGRTVSVGLCGHVFTMSKDDIDHAVSQYMQRSLDNIDKLDSTSDAE